MSDQTCDSLAKSEDVKEDNDKAKEWFEGLDLTKNPIVDKSDVDRLMEVMDTFQSLDDKDPPLFKPSDHLASKKLLFLAIQALRYVQSYQKVAIRPGFFPPILRNLFKLSFFSYSCHFYSGPNRPLTTDPSSLLLFCFN